MSMFMYISYQLFLHKLTWLVVLTILKNMSSSMGRIIMDYPHMTWKIKNVWNHQPVTFWTPPNVWIAISTVSTFPRLGRRLLINHHLVHLLPGTWSIYGIIWLNGVISFKTYWFFKPLCNMYKYKYIYTYIINKI